MATLLQSLFMPGHKLGSDRSALDVPQVASPGWTLQGADLPDDDSKGVDVRLVCHLACRPEAHSVTCILPAPASLLVTSPSYLSGNTLSQAPFPLHGP